MILPNKTTEAHHLSCRCGEHRISWGTKRCVHCARKREVDEESVYYNFLVLFLNLYEYNQGSIQWIFHLFTTSVNKRLAFRNILRELGWREYVIEALIMEVEYRIKREYEY